VATLQRPDSNFDALETPLYGVTARLRLIRLVLFASRGALAGTALSLLAVILDDFALLPDWFSLYVFIPVAILLGGGIGGVLGALKRISLRSAAALTESRLGLKERITSAMEFSRDPANYHKDAEATLLLRLQQEDAVFHARLIRPSAAVPFKMSWETKALIPAFVILMLAILLPNLFALISPRERNEQAIVGQTGVRLIKSADDLEKEAIAHREAETLHIAQSMRRLGQQMRHGHMDKRQAMLNKQIDDARKSLNASGGLANPGDLNQAGQQLAKELAAEKSLFGNIPGQNIPKKGQASANPSTTSGDIKNAADSTQEDNAMGLGDQLRKMANRLSTQNVSPQEQKQTAGALDKLAQALQGPSLQDAKQHVQAAADALRKGDKTTGANELRKAADSIDKAMQKSQDAQQDSSGLDDAQSSVQNTQDSMAKAQTPAQANSNSGSSQGKSGQNGQSGKNGQSGQSGQQDQSGQGQSGQGGQQGQSGQNGQGQSGQGQSGQGGQGQSGQSGQGQSGQGQSGQGQSGQGQSGQNGQGSEGSNGGNGHSGSSASGGSKSAGNSSGGGRSQGQGSTGHSPGTQPPNRTWDSDSHMQDAAGKFAIPSGNRAGYKGGMDSAPRMSLPSQTMGQQQSKVPYEQSVDQARRTSETAMDNEDIAPADRALVRKYYDSLAQSH